MGAVFEPACMTVATPVDTRCPAVAAMLDSPGHPVAMVFDAPCRTRMAACRKTMRLAVAAAIDHARAMVAAAVDHACPVVAAVIDPMGLVLHAMRGALAGVLGRCGAGGKQAQRGQHGQRQDFHGRSLVMTRDSGPSDAETPQPQEG